MQNLDISYAKGQPLIGREISGLVPHENEERIDPGHLQILIEPAPKTQPASPPESWTFAWSSPSVLEPPVGEEETIREMDPCPPSQKETPN